MKKSLITILVVLIFVFSFCLLMNVFRPYFASEEMMTSRDNSKFSYDNTNAIDTLCSSNLPLIKIYTSPDAMDSVNASVDKSYKARGRILIISPNGDILYEGNLKHIKGRGNSSWFSAKKPYNIKLEKKTNLLGLRASNTYCLLSTAPLRNLISYWVAIELGMKYAIDLRPVNLLINDDYKGLYLLSEKVAAGKSGAGLHMAPNEPDGGVLLESVQVYAHPEMSICMSYGELMALKDPEKVCERQRRHIEVLHQEMESALKNSEGVCPTSGKHYTEYMDINSFAKYYLLQETFVNVDGFRGSCYIYKDADSIDSRFYAGPLWDMDLTMGKGFDWSGNLPDALYLRSRHNTYSRLLCGHPYFWDTVRYIWNKEMSPLMKEWFNIRIDTLFKALETDLMNDCKRNGFKNTPKQEFEQMKEFMLNRIQFLDRIMKDTTRQYIHVVLRHHLQGFYEDLPMELWLSPGDTIPFSRIRTKLEGYVFTGIYDRYGRRLDTITPIVSDCELTMYWMYASKRKRINGIPEDLRFRFRKWRRTML